MRISKRLACIMYQCLGHQVKCALWRLFPTSTMWHTCRRNGIGWITRLSFQNFLFKPSMRKSLVNTFPGCTAICWPFVTIDLRLGANALHIIYFSWSVARGSLVKELTFQQPMQPTEISGGAWAKFLSNLGATKKFFDVGVEDPDTMVMSWSHGVRESVFPRSCAVAGRAKRCRKMSKTFGD